jgi:hypothetical protein
MSKLWNQNIDEFIALAGKHNVRMLMVGGGAVKFSPIDLDLELITKFSVNKSFEEAYNDSEEITVNDKTFLKWNVLSLEDLITSKIKANRAKDLLDVQQLREINKK